MFANLSLAQVTVATAVIATFSLFTLLWWGWQRHLTTQAAADLPAVDRRWLRLLAAVALAGYGSYLLGRQEPAFGPFLWAEFLNGRLRFDLVNLHNVIVGVPLLLVGSLLFVREVRGVNPWTVDQPLAQWKLRPGRMAATPRVWATAVILLASTAVLLLYRHAGWLPVLTWLAALLLLSRFWWRQDRRIGLDLSLHLTRWDVLLLLVLLIIGIVLGVVYLVEVPARMIGDEGAFWEAARGIALGNHQPSLFDLGVYTFPVASSFFQAMVLRLTGLSLWSWRFASVLAGVLAVIPLYLLAREGFGRGTAVIAGLLMLTSPYFLAFARLGYNNSQALLPVTLAAGCFFLGVRRASYFYIWLAGLAAGLGFYTYTAGRLALVVLLLAVLLLLIRRDLAWRSGLKVTAVFLLGWGMTVLSLDLYGLNRPGEVEPYKIWESLFFNVFYGRAYYPDEVLFQYAEPLRIGYQELFFQPVVYLHLLLRGFVRSVLAFHSPFFGGQEHFVETGLAGGGLTGTFFVLGSVLALARWRQFRFGLLLLWLAGGLFFLSIINTLPPRPTHLVVTIPVLALITAIGLVSFVTVFSQSLGQNFMRVDPPRWRASLLVVLTALMAFVGVQQYFGPLGQKYPANFEQLVAWTAVRLQRPAVANLVFIEEQPQHHDVAYLVWANVVDVAYENLPRDAVLAETPSRLNEGRVVAFIPAAENQEVVQAAARLIPKSLPILPLNGPHGDLWGYVVADVPLPLPPKLTAVGAIQSVVASPAVWLLALLVLLMGGVILALLRDGLGPVRLRFSFRPDQVAREEEPVPETTTRRLHVYFGLDLQIDLKNQEKRR